MLVYQVVGWISLAIRVLTWLIFIDALLSWIPQINRYNPWVRALRRVTEPIYAPIRRIIPPERTGYIDLSPLIAILGLQLIGGVLVSVIVSVLGR